MCLLFCTWTMRGVLEKNLNQNRQNLWKNRKGRKYRFHCVWMLNRCVTFESNRKETRAKEEQQCPATHWRDRSVCALFSCQLFIFTIYSIYLFCLSYSCVCVCFVWAIQTQTPIYIFNLFYSLSLFIVSEIQHQIPMVNEMKVDMREGKTTKSDKNATQSDVGTSIASAVQ